MCQLAYTAVTVHTETAFMLTRDSSAHIRLVQLSPSWAANLSSLVTRLLCQFGNKDAQYTLYCTTLTTKLSAVVPLPCTAQLQSTRLCHSEPSYLLNPSFCMLPAALLCLLDQHCSDIQSSARSAQTNSSLHYQGQLKTCDTAYGHISAKILPGDPRPPPPPSHSPTHAHTVKADCFPSGVSIAVMGCIVNGPGEMADADFGYVGGAPGKIDLYVGKEVVRRAIPMAGATDELIELIKVCLPAFGC